MPKLFFAPLQGYTHWLYRQAHHRFCGGVDEYYTPFLRVEHGTIRNKDRRDVTPENNVGVSVVPQLIAANRDEFAALCDFLQQQGWGRVDLNMGCPFPMQVHAGRGSGLLPHPDRLAPILQEMALRPEVRFSVKLRLGQQDANELFDLLPLLNASPLTHITLHPRLGMQQYKGEVDMERFAQFYDQCTVPLVYNGNITSIEQLDKLLQRFPNLHGVMLGRGLLARPWLAQEWRSGMVADESAHRQQLLAIHNEMMRYAEQQLQGETQMLAFLHSFWDYPGTMLPKKVLKGLKKSGSLRSYREALAALR